MPMAPKRPCSRFPCPHLMPCPVHGRTATPKQYGYANDPGRLRGWANTKMRRQVFSEEAYCYLCGRPGTDTDVLEHVRGRAAGGGNERENLRRSCRACNRAKQARESAAGKRRA